MGLPSVQTCIVDATTPPPGGVQGRLTKSIKVASVLCFILHSTIQNNLWFWLDLFNAEFSPKAKGVLAGTEIPGGGGRGRPHL